MFTPLGSLCVCLLGSLLFLGSALSANTLTFDADPGAHGLQTGNARWHDAGVWWNGTANVSWVDGSDAVIPAGSRVSLRQAATVGTVTLDGSVQLRNVPWVIRGETLGQGTVLADFGGSQSTGRGVIVETVGETTMAWTIRGAGDFQKTLLVAARGAGVELIYDGAWIHTGGGNRAFAVAYQGARITFGPNARINNQLPNWNARDFRLISFEDGTFAFADGYDTDLGGTQENPIGGLSVYRLVDTELTTESSENLPQIWKGTGLGVRRHGGLKIWPTGDFTTTWRAEKNPHVFNGGVAWTRSWTIDAQVDITHTTNGRFETSLDDGWGPNWGVTENTTMRKTGPGRLILKGDHAYPRGSVYDIVEGSIEMYSNPNYTGAHPNPNAQVGAYLATRTADGSALRLFPLMGESWQAESINQAAGGVLHLENGGLELSGNYMLGSAGRLSLKHGASALALGPVLTVDGDVNLSGTIAIEEVAGEPVLAGRYPLLRYGNLSANTATLEVAGSSLSSLSTRLEDDAGNQQIVLVVESAGVSYADWQQEHFSAAEITSGLASPAVDANSNGETNLVAYATGDDPRAEAPTIPALRVSVVDGVAILTTRINPQAQGIIVRIQMMDTPGTAPTLLASSVSGAALVATEAAAVTASSPESVIEVPVGNDRQFFQLEVEER